MFGRHWKNSIKQISLYYFFRIFNFPMCTVNLQNKYIVNIYSWFKQLDFLCSNTLSDEPECIWYLMFKDKLDNLLKTTSTFPICGIPYQYLHIQQYQGHEYTVLEPPTVLPTTSISPLKPQFTQPVTTANDMTENHEHMTNLVLTGTTDIAIWPTVTFPLLKIRLGHRIIAQVGKYSRENCNGTAIRRAID